MLISIHAPTRGATLWKSGHVGVYIDFNPRSHEGSDLQRLVYHEIIVISIHAPTRGATLLWSLLSMLRAIFQSTLPRGERLAQQYEWDSITVISIHAPTRGATFEAADSIQTRKDFNPRSHEGSDRCSYKLTNMSLISIHAPTRGATAISMNEVSKVLDFNPRSHEGSD